MIDVLRGRDCIVYFAGDRQTVAVAPTMISSGWPGGQGVQWDDANPEDVRRVTYSTGLYGGFLVWGSDEPADQYTAMSGQFVAYRYATMFSGGCLIETTSYERYTYASRVGPGPRVPLVYTPNAVLYLSRRGLWTIEDEMTLVGDPKAPAFFTGFVSKIPGQANGWLGIQTSM